MLNNKHVGWGEVRTPTAVLIQPQRVGVRTSPQPTIKVMLNKKIQPDAIAGWARFLCPRGYCEYRQHPRGQKSMPTLQLPKR